MSRYDDETNRIIQRAKAQGYTAINIDSCPWLSYRGGYEITAKEGVNNVRVVIARASSWAKCYREAIEYLR